MHPARDMDKAAFVAWNEAMAAKYDPDGYHNHSHPFIRWVESLRTRAIVRLVGPAPGRRILEVGCGAGNVLERMPHGALTGVDLSPALLEKARRRLAGRARLLQGDAESLVETIGGERFDVAFASEVLEHVQRPEQVVAQMAAVLAPGGTVVLSIPNEPLINGVKSWLARLAMLGRLFPGMARRMDDEWHVHAFDDRLLRQTVSGILRIRKRIAVPSPALPLRYVYLLTPEA